MRGKIFTEGGSCLEVTEEIMETDSDSKRHLDRHLFDNAKKDMD